MLITVPALLDFAQSIPDRCSSERATLLEPCQGNWDTCVRKQFSEALGRWFCEDFSLSSKEETKKYVYAEGSNPIPKTLRGDAFFETTMHPDAALFIGNTPVVAIELDHGTKGGQMRNALAKAGFDVKLGGFKRAMVLFFIDPPKSPSDFEKQEKGEERTLSLYETQFHTSLHIL